MANGRLADRYRYSTSVKVGDRTIGFLAVDELSGNTVLAAPLSAQRVEALRGAVELEHPNLAKVLALDESPEPSALPPELDAVRVAGVALAEVVNGRQLHEQLKSARMPAPLAVDIIARICAAVEALHEKGAVHGAISPRSIVFDNARRSPVLTQFATPTSGLYSSRERLQKRGPSIEDDSWALHATLYTALTGEPPFAGSTREDLMRSMLATEPGKLSAFGLDEPLLQELIDRGIVHNPRWRASVADLKQGLTNWLNERGLSLEVQAAPNGENGRWPDEPAMASRPSLPPLAMHEEESIPPPPVAEAARSAIPDAPRVPDVAPMAAADAADGGGSQGAAPESATTPNDEARLPSDAPASAPLAPAKSEPESTVPSNPSDRPSRADALVGLFAEEESSRRRGRKLLILAIVVLFGAAVYYGVRLYQDFQKTGRLELGLVDVPASAIVPSRKQAESGVPPALLVQGSVTELRWVLALSSGARVSAA